MPGEARDMLNRELLGEQGRRLDAADYVRVVAAMGVGAITGKPELGPSAAEAGWSPDAFLVARARLRDLDAGALARVGVESWRRFVGDHSVSRISIRRVGWWSQEPDPNEVLSILRHPTLELAAAWIELALPEADLRWQWPLRVGAFPDDFHEIELPALSGTELWPANTLTRPRGIDRDDARSEILVARGDARTVLGRVLGLKHRLRTGLLVLIAPGGAPWAGMRPYVDALLRETQAGGVALVQLVAEGRVVDALNALVMQLSHNEPLDVAMSRAFGIRRSTLILDRRLLAAVELNVGFAATADRLQELTRASRRARLELPEETVTRIGLDWRDDRPTSELATEMTAKASTGDISFAAESAGASALSEIETAMRGAEREHAQDEGPRFLQGNVFRYSGSETVPERRAFVFDEAHALDVFISAEAEGALHADQALPLDDIDWGRREAVSVQVMLAEPNQWEQPLLGRIRLPRHGRSSTHRFTFTPSRTGPFKGRVTIYYRGRILQTALLESHVVKSIKSLKEIADDTPSMVFRVEAAVRRSFATLDERRRFDACIVCNHTSTREAAITAAGQDGAFVSSLAKLGTPLANINSLLTQVAHDADRHRRGLTSRANAELLEKLAMEGNALYRAIVLDYIKVSSAANALRDAEYLQIVTMDADSIVPLEFVYDYPVPKAKAPVCKQAKRALKSGECPSTCRPTQGPAAHSCPLGFWGMRKVIERHIHVPGLDKAAKIVASEPIKDRDTLSLSGRTLVGLSQEVSSPAEAQLLKTLDRIRKREVTRAEGWQQWRNAVATEKPVMLVLLPHADGVQPSITLEISGEEARSVDIDQGYVRAESAPPPLTVLLGCDTANTADPSAYLTHVGVFRQADAALVLGTIATVFGAHAADMTGRLLECVEASIRSGPRRFGEALLKAKQDAVASSEMIGMCLVAFGDADWQIVSGE